MSSLLPRSLTACPSHTLSRVPSLSFHLSLVSSLSLSFSHSLVFHLSACLCPVSCPELMPHSSKSYPAPTCSAPTASHSIAPHPSQHGPTPPHPTVLHPFGYCPGCIAVHPSPSRPVPPSISSPLRPFPSLPATPLSGTHLPSIHDIFYGSLYTNASLVGRQRGWLGRLAICLSLPPPVHCARVQYAAIKRIVAVTGITKSGVAM